MQSSDPILSSILALIPNLTIASVFILAWWQERKERQCLNDKVLEMQTAHREEMLKIIERMFAVLSGLHMTIPGPMISITQPDDEKLRTP